MSKITFLKKREALGSQVAGFLLNEGSRDLSDTEVWVPTAGAARVGIPWLAWRILFTAVLAGAV